MSPRASRIVTGCTALRRSVWFPVTVEERIARERLQRSR